MPNPILLVCQSCNSVHCEEIDYEKSEGAYLVNQLLTLHQYWSRRNELEIRPTACLWMCSHPCAVVFSGANKSTYLFTKISSKNGAEALLQFGELYLDSDDGNIPWSKLSEPLKSGELARIPPVSQN